MLILERLLVPIRLVKGIRLVAALTLFAAGVVSADTAPADSNDAAQGSSIFTPMPDNAAQGVGCLVASSGSLGAAYLLGPTEIMMLVTGAVIVPSSSSLLFLALGGILGAGSCGVGAAATPAVLWAANNADGIEAKLTPTLSSVNKRAVKQDPPAVVPMNEGEMQGAGCLLGVLGLGAITLAAAPTEMVMLAAGGVTAPSKTSILMLGVIGTILPAGCTMGSAAALPLVALYQNFDTNAIGQKLASLVGWNRPSSSAPGLQAGASGAKVRQSQAEPTSSLQVGQQDSVESVLLPLTYYTP